VEDVAAAEIIENRIEEAHDGVMVRNGPGGVNASAGQACGV
jgi:hypothetical protein